MMRAGINQHTAMSITGHKTDGMFRRYHIIDHSEHVSTVAKMERVAPVKSRLPVPSWTESHKTASATVATAKPESSQVQ